jgi:Terminase large subunit, T4likevirus-type, N-terminal
MNALASALLRGVDPVALAADLELDLDDWQAEVLRSDGDVLVNGARQVGKSTISALKVLHRALYVPGSLCLLVAPAHRQSLETFRTATLLYKALGKPVPEEALNTMAISLENGSRILALPGSETTLRGYGAVSLIVVDEAARVPDELYHSVRPMLAVSRGSMVCISTPNGRRGWWYSAWSDEGSSWQRHLVLAADCPRIAPEYLAERRREMPDWWYAQEFEGAFTDSDRQAFASADIEAAFDQEVQTWNVCR